MEVVAGDTVIHVVCTGNRRMTACYLGPARYKDVCEVWPRDLLAVVDVGGPGPIADCNLQAAGRTHKLDGRIVTICRYKGAANDQRQPTQDVSCLHRLRP